MKKVKNRLKKVDSKKKEENFETNLEYRKESFNLKTGLNDYE